MDHTVDRRIRYQHRRGFTLVEMLVVLLVAALVAGIVAPAVGSVQERMSLTNATNGVVLLSARARAHATNRGAVALLEIDPVYDEAWVRFGSDTVAGSFVDFDEQFGADIQMSDEDELLSVCYSPRGYAQPGCSDNPRLPVHVLLSRGGRTDSVQIQALGQVELPE